MGTNRQSRTSLTAWGRAHLVWAATVVGCFALVLGGAALSEQPEGTCSGIGWGCTLSGPDLAVLILMFVGPVVLGVLLAGHLLIGVACRIVRRIERRRGAESETPVGAAHH